MQIIPVIRRVTLPALREDIALQASVQGRDGSPHWDIYDPVRNNFFRIGWLEFELLTRWQEGMSATDLCAAVCAETPLNAGEEDVFSLIIFLQRNELLRAALPAQRAALLEMWSKRKLSVWQWLLHHYLFIRIPLLKPEAFLNRTLPYLDFIFRPAFFWVMGGVALLGVVRVIDLWSEFSKTFMYFFSWQGFIFYALALSLAKSFHELAHAYTAKRFGLRVPTMGLAFMVMMPLLYTDTSEGWKLKSRKHRLLIDGAGVLAEMCLAGIALLLWSFLPEGPLKSATYILAAVTLVSTLGINLNPFMRFDGYYLLMDAVDVPNLQPRSFALGRWQLRRWVLGLQEEIPETEFEAQKNWLLLYAYSTWIYRLILFTGIAVLVYYFFFKLLGIILFAAEIGWFVILPIWRELKAWWLLKQRWQDNDEAQRSIVLLMMLLFVLSVPWHIEVGGEGYWQADPYTRIYPPTAAWLSKILVSEGQLVHKGDVLFELDSPTTDWQLNAAEKRIVGIEAQLAGTVDSEKLLEKQSALEQQLGEAHAQLAAGRDESHRLQILAPHDGVFRDMANGLYPGAWLAMKRELGLVVGEQGGYAQIFVSESNIGRIALGAQATIWTRAADSHSFAGVVSDIDNTATISLPEAMLASPLGGHIAARIGKNGEMIAHESVYRVTLKTSEAARHLTPVIARIDAARSSFLLDAARGLANLFIRESGF